MLLNFRVVLDVYGTMCANLPKISKEKKKECFKFFIPLGFFYISLILCFYLELYQTYTFEIILLNGFVYATVLAQEIVGILSKVNKFFIMHFLNHL
jgi:hypothetical protein